MDGGKLYQTPLFVGANLCAMVVEKRGGSPLTAALHPPAEGVVAVADGVDVILVGNEAAESVVLVTRSILRRTPAIFIVGIGVLAVVEQLVQGVDDKGNAIFFAAVAQGVVGVAVDEGAILFDEAVLSVVLVAGNRFSFGIFNGGGDEVADGVVVEHLLVVGTVDLRTLTAGAPAIRHLCTVG